jgi:D-alanyl-D-alanine carboxypeptidase
VIARVVTPEGTWTSAAGVADPAGSEAPTPSDHTRVGSLTKTMTATILLQLVGERLVSLDDPISKYVPDAPNGSATLLQVADMTSGIASYTLDESIQNQWLQAPEAVFTPQQLLDAAKTLPVLGEPGTVWQYSNTNYVLLGMLIENVTGRPIADVFQERIFEPLGMDASTYPGSSADLPEPYLHGTTDQPSPGTPVDATDWNPSFASTAGEVVSTLDDMTTWAHALFTGEGVLTPELQQVRRDSILSSPPPNTETAGYGIGIGDRDGWWGHDGEIPGYTTSVFHSYDDDVTIVVLANSDVKTAAGAAPAASVYQALAAALG